MKNIFDIFLKFFTLGFISFGGPMAHIAYFRKKFVEDLKWLDDKAYAKILALSNFLPGPSSSQVGFTIGLKRGGFLGALSAFIAFTLPSFLFLYFLATFNLTNSSNSFINELIFALKLFAVVIVTDATISMFKNFCKDKITFYIFIFASFILIVFPSALTQIIVLIIAGFIGKVFIKKEGNKEENIKKTKTKKLPLFLFLALLVFSLFFTSENLKLRVFQEFYEVGSLVFGGGHVVLPLLQENLNIFLSKDDFLLGYSFAQAVPGPMFTIASFLGASIDENSSFIFALLATLAIFLPGFLLILAFYESFEEYSKKTSLIKVLAGVNAAVVALLAAVLLKTVIPSAIYSFFDVFIVLMGLLALRVFKTPIIYLILGFLFIGVLSYIF